MRAKDPFLPACPSQAHQPSVSKSGGGFPVRFPLVRKTFRMESLFCFRFLEEVPIYMAMPDAADRFNSHAEEREL